jgi:uncharacterized protein (DUF305 family)
MTKTLVVGIIMSVIVGLGIGIAIGRNAEPFKIGPKIQNNGEKMGSERSQEQYTQKTDDFDEKFLTDMITHHEDAVMMAKEKSIRPEITQMADDIIKNQSREIEHMKLWREEWYGNR